MSREHIYNHGQYLWDMRFIDLLRNGKTQQAVDEMPEFISQAISETDAGSLTWLLHCLGMPDYPAEPQGKRTFSQPNRPAHPLARVQVYPNPATDHLIIQWDWLQLGLSEALLIELYTMDGHLLQSQRVEDFARNTSVVRLHDHLAGSYILRLRSGEDVVYSETLLLQ